MRSYLYHRQRGRRRLASNRGDTCRDPVQDLIDDVLGGVESVFAEYELREASAVRWPGWRTVIRDTNERTWIRADVGGIVDIHRDSGSLVSAGARVCTLRIRSKATASPSKPRLPGC
jgi:hypothetical protein